MSEKERTMESVDEICGVLSEVHLDRDECGKNIGNATKFVSIKPKELSKEEELWWEKLKLLQCPFSWEDLHEIGNDDKTADKSKTRMSQIEEKMEEIEEPDTFQYRKLILNIVLVYEHFCNGDSGISLAVLRETEALLTSSSSTKGALRKLITNIKAALHHVVLACRVYIQFFSHVLSEVERTFAKITRYDDLNDMCKAAISGVHAAALMEYGYRGNVAAMKHIETALCLDPDEGEWHFLLGKCMGRLRRIDASFQVPSKRELKALEEAVRMTKNPPYIVFLAQSYRETAFRVYSEKRHDSTLSTATGAIDKMNERSLVLYKEVMDLRPECSHVNVRCALGFMKLPNPYKDLPRAKECLDMALKHAPNNAMVNHTMGMFYERHERNMTEAKKYYKRAGELGAFGSFMDLLRLRYNENKFDFNPIPDLESARKIYPDVPHQQELTMQMGSYHLFIKDDVETAYKYWEMVIDQDPESEKLKKHKCLFLRMLKPVNIYEVLCDESRLILQLKPYKAKGKESLYRRIIMKCSKQYPECATTSPIPRRKMVLAEVDEVEKGRFRPKLRGRGRGRGPRGGRRGREGGREGGRDQSVGEPGRGGRGGERGRWSRGGERGRGNRGGGRGRGYHSRDSSTDSHHKDLSSARQGTNNYEGRYSRDSSAGSYYKHHSTERRGVGGSRGDTRTGRYSRDSSTEGYTKHLISERRGSSGHRNDDKTNNTGAYHRRDSSSNGRYDEDRPGSQNRHRPGEYRRDSSADSRSSYGSVDSAGKREHSWRGRSRGGRSGHGGRWTGNGRDRSDVETNWRTGPRERNNSESSTEGSMARKLSAGRVRTDSTGSTNSCPDETKIDWKQGCRMSPSTSISEDFVRSRNTHFKQQHSELKKSQGGYKMWWSEQE